MVVRILLLAIGAAAVAFELAGPTALGRTVLTDLALAVVVASAFAHRGRPRDLPLPRSRLLGLVPAAIAIAVGLPTVALPYVSDDYCQLIEIGSQPTPFHALLPSPNEHMLRPIGRLPWWLFERLSPLDATLARSFAVFVLALDAALVVPALRRCGVPRGIAVAAGCLFAANPLGLETLAWTTNLYSLFSTGFALGAIASLPERGARLSRMFVPAALVGLSILSREDTYFVPWLLPFAGARFRFAHLKRWAFLCAPAYAAFFAVVALRLAVFGGLGGYGNPETGDGTWLAAWSIGAPVAAQKEVPIALLLPLRSNVPTWGIDLPAWSGLALLALLVLGGASAAARRVVPRGAALALCGLAVTFPLLPLGNSLSTARMAFFATVGVSAIAASLLAGLPFLDRSRWLAVAGLLAASWGVGRSNFDAWRRTGACIEGAIAATTPILASLSHAGRVLVNGLPGDVEGAVCFMNAGHLALKRACGRPDLDVGEGGMSFGTFAAVLDVDPALAAAVDVSRASPTLAPPQVWTFEPGGSGRAASHVDEVEGVDGDDGWQFWTTTARSGLLRLPLLRVEPGDSLRISGDVRTVGARGEPVQVPLALLLCGEQAVARVRAPERFVVPPQVRTLRVEVVIPPTLRVTVRRVEIAREG
ncbi:MAG TPA: hypothetical protein VKE69_11755 [Planctomycetota bacterium]|nr:hypothetical protein [Planctomycetota bacterium]